MDHAASAKQIPIADCFHFMEERDKLRRLFLRQAQSLEKRALELQAESAEQDELLDMTVSLRILAELRLYKGAAH